jgi:hypothetical protein
VLSENLTTDEGEVRSNSDPVTGQGAWFDARVKIERAQDQSDAVTSPMFDPVKALNKQKRPDVLQYGFDKDMRFNQHERALGTSKKKEEK